MTEHQLWLDTINLNVKSGKTLEEALQCADAMQQWPFRTVNGVQTPESAALQANKAAHAASKFNPNTCEEALL